MALRNKNYTKLYNEKKLRKKYVQIVTKKKKMTKSEKVISRLL